MNSNLVPPTAVATDAHTETGANECAGRGSALALILLTSFTLFFSVLSLVILASKVIGRRRRYQSLGDMTWAAPTPAVKSSVQVAVPSYVGPPAVCSTKVGALSSAAGSFAEDGHHLPFGDSEGSAASEVAMAYSCFISYLYNTTTLHVSYLHRLDRSLDAWLSSMESQRRMWAQAHLEMIFSHNRVSFQTRCRKFEELWTGYSEWLMNPAKTRCSEPSIVTVHQL